MRRSPRFVVPLIGLAIALAGVFAAAEAFARKEKPKAPPPPPRIGVPAPKPRTKDAIRLASYNIENLFDNKDDPALSGENDDIDDAKPEAHKAGVAAAIKRIDADVVALEEIESYDALIEFRDQYLKGLGYEHVVSIDAGDERGIENAVISRFPIIDSKNFVGTELEAKHPEKDGRNPNKWFGKPVTFHRSPLRVTVEVPAEKTAKGEPYRLTLFVVHAKSSRNFNYWREAESRGTLKLIEEFTKEDAGANIAVLGDFNAETMDESLQIYLSNGFKDLFIDRPLDDPKMFTHASERAIDLILYNKALEPEIVRQSRFVLGTPQIDEMADWRTAPKPEGYASDHCPIVVDIVPVEK